MIKKLNFIFLKCMPFNTYAHEMSQVLVAVPINLLTGISLIGLAHLEYYRNEGFVNSSEQ